MGAVIYFAQVVILDPVSEKTCHVDSYSTGLGRCMTGRYCDRDEASRTALLCCSSHSLRHLLGPVHNISFVRIVGQGLS
jgi:hypothetical protein